ncbi:hypothetical protein MBAV_000929, partial [Candidatus Magnetobacterium bavaricum]
IEILWKENIQHLKRRRNHFISDEIFAGSMPILITIEPKSTAILRIEIAENRKSESWKNHWVEIEKNYFYTLGLVSDRGKGLC